MNAHSVVGVTTGRPLDRRRRRRQSEPSGQAVMSQEALAVMDRHQEAIEASRVVDRWLDDDPDVTSEQANRALLVVDAYFQKRRARERGAHAQAGPA